MTKPMELTYFPLMARGLGPALVAECSGLPWTGPKDTGFTFAAWEDLKASGASPFGQLPLLRDGDLAVGQTIAILNYVGRKAGTEGKDDAEFAVSQMLLAEGEDLFALLNKHQPTMYASLEKKPQADQTKLWGELVPGELGKLETLLGERKSFTSSGKTPGELYVFAVVHQIVLVKPGCLEAFPHFKAFYEGYLADASVQKVLKGESNFGPIEPYFVAC